MSKLFSLDDRLAACASFVRDNTKIADIGTDHAYLPVWLAKQGRIKGAIAADIRPMPLERGAENIRKYQCEDIVTTRLSDGLKEISPDEVDDVIIAGMGAELIVDIINNAKWLKKGDRRLILQPMTKAHILRKYLVENGFEIIREKACKHGGKNYSVIFAFYSGEIKDYSTTFQYIGKLDNNDSLAVEYIEQVLKKLAYKSKGKKHSGEDSSEIDNIIDEIKRLFGKEQ